MKKRGKKHLIMLPYSLELLFVMKSSTQIYFKLRNLLEINCKNVLLPFLTNFPFTPPGAPPNSTENPSKDESADSEDFGDGEQETPKMPTKVSCKKPVVKTAVLKTTSEDVSENVPGNLVEKGKNHCTISGEKELFV